MGALFPSTYDRASMAQMTIIPARAIMPSTLYTISEKMIVCNSSCNGHPLRRSRPGDVIVSQVYSFQATPSVNLGGTADQDPVHHQLLIALFRLGKYGNGSGIGHTASYLCCGDGTAEIYTWRCHHSHTISEKMIVCNSSCNGHPLRRSRPGDVIVSQVYYSHRPTTGHRWRK
jgi:hypothetical protein